MISFMFRYFPQATALITRIDYKNCSVLNWRQLSANNKRLDIFQFFEEKTFGRKPNALSYPR